VTHSARSLTCPCLVHPLGRKAQAASEYARRRTDTSNQAVQACLSAGRDAFNGVLDQALGHADQGADGPTVQCWGPLEKVMQQLGQGQTLACAQQAADVAIRRAAEATTDQGVSADQVLQTFKATEDESRVSSWWGQVDRNIADSRGTFSQLVKRSGTPFSLASGSHRVHATVSSPLLKRH
jgi:hypothetical protein